MNDGNPKIRRIYNYMIYLFLLTGILVILNSCAKNAPFEPVPAKSAELNTGVQKDLEYTKAQYDYTGTGKQIESPEKDESPGPDKEKRWIGSSSRYSVAYSDKPVTF